MRPQPDDSVTAQRLMELAAMNPTTATGMRQQAYDIASLALFCFGKEISDVFKHIVDKRPFLHGLINEEFRRMYQRFSSVR